MILPAMLLIVLVSGCMQEAEQCPVVVSQTEGIVISRFEPSYNLIPVGSEIMLQMDLQNRGNAIADNVVARIWAHGGFSMLKDDVEDESAATVDVPDLVEPDLTICASGDTYTVNWNLRANCDPTESTLAAVVDYDYSSEGWAKILLASHAESTRTRGIFPETGENHPSAGPVQVIIEPLQTEPVILSENADTFDVRIKFENVGDGQVGETGMGNIDYILMTVQGPCTFIDPEGNPNDPNSLWPIVDVHKLGGIQLAAGTKNALKIVSLKYDGDVSDLIKDFCTINADIKYHYQEYVSTDFQMGITGTTDQVTRCRKLYGEKTIYWECLYNAGYEENDGWYWLNSEGHTVLGDRALTQENSQCVTPLNCTPSLTGIVPEGDANECDGTSIYNGVDYDFSIYLHNKCLCRGGTLSGAEWEDIDPEDVEEEPTDEEPTEEEELPTSPVTTMTLSGPGDGDNLCAGQGMNCLVIIRNELIGNDIVSGACSDFAVDSNDKAVCVNAPVSDLRSIGTGEQICTAQGLSCVLGTEIAYFDVDTKTCDRDLSSPGDLGGWRVICAGIPAHSTVVVGNGGTGDEICAERAMSCVLGLKTLLDSTDVKECSEDMSPFYKVICI